MNDSLGTGRTEGSEAQPAQIHSEGIAAGKWKTPELTTVDLTEITMAMGPGASDSGILS